VVFVTLMTLSRDDRVMFRLPSGPVRALPTPSPTTSWPSFTIAYANPVALPVSESRMCCRISTAVDGPVPKVGGGALTPAAATESTATAAETSAQRKCLPDIVPSSGVD
jgi:hypothetical protein